MAESLLNSLELPLDELFPGELQQEKPPTAIGLANGIPLWVKYYFKRTLMSGVHFEHQLYGPDNTYLQSIFSPARRFAIIPQALLRRVIKQGRVKDLNVSTGSTGGIHWGRTSGWSAVGKTFPDFFAVKVFPTPESEPRKHYVVCVVEVKLAEAAAGDVERVNTAEMQMFGYMKTLINHPYRVKQLKGYLLVGTKYLEYQINEETKDVDYVPGQYKNMFAAGDPLTIALCDIAVQEWNRTSENAPNIWPDLEFDD
ncbi:hypothetical protein BDP27DRAFT_1400930 [Rhodocollybia butyracea]|uniref:Uncharacterized protein n=1 Tax=Rhodocollybia butyracea TaxID=206335 RepID=A0A9P5PZT0_9AGAR|nr:hypothetical protein BDP27DRAFT_1400930 [Rhodocollybia butyracea]